jgi:hypothetical protein
MKSMTPGQDAGRLRADVLLALIALAALAVGVLVYMLDRPAGSAYFLPQVASFANGHHFWFRALGGRLPEFAHVYAFILLTVAVSPWPGRVLPLCVFWWVLATLAELAQHPALALRVVALVPDWFQQLPVLDNTASYFVHGTFDPWDLVAIALGTVSAYVTVRWLQYRPARELSVADESDRMKLPKDA